MSSPFLTNKLLCDWLSYNFHYSFSIQREQQRQIINEALVAIGEKHQAVKMGDFATAYQTDNFLFVNVNKRFLQVQFQGKYFLENDLVSAGTLIKKISEKLNRLEKIERRIDTTITHSISRMDIQKTKVSNEVLNLMEVNKSFNSLTSFFHLIYAVKTEGQYKILGETIKDRIRWKLRRYDKLAQITSEYSEDERKIFFNKYPNVPLVRTELQISDTQFLNQFQPHFLNQEIDLVDILKKWNKRRKVDIIENELIQTSPLIESSLETFNQNGLRVGLCKANPSGISDNLNKLIEWIDNDPLAKPEEIINQMVSAMGHNEQVAELVKKIWFRV